MAVEQPTGVARSAHGRQIGPVGTMTRIAGGLAAIALPIALSGITWWDVATALVVLPLMAMLAAAAVTAVYRRSAVNTARAGDGEAWIRSAVVLALVVGIGTPLTFVSPVDGTAIWIFIGLSLLIAAFRGDGGCEAVALPNALSGRRDPIGCVIYAPIDVVEARRRRR